jgi:septal ring factor EnvC (AmiA/AmiB activator)
MGLKKASRRLMAFLILLVLITASFEGSAESSNHRKADSNTDLSTKITKEKKELDQLKKKIQDQRRKSQAARKKERSVLSDLEEINYRLALKKKELSVIDLKLRQRDKEIERLNRDLRDLQDEVASKRDEVRDRIRTLYQENRMNSLRVLFASTDYYDFLKRYYYLHWVSQKESQLLSSYMDTVARMEEKESKLRAARTDLLKDKREVAALLSDIQADKRTRAVLLKRVREEKATYERAIRELEESAGRVTSFIQELEKQRKTASLPAIGFSYQKGKLYWPAPGKVVAFFGRHKHPKFDTFINRKGIEIQAGQGQPIRSVYKGTVVYADWFQGYGLLTIVDHGENYYSLYAHAARLQVSVGDQVETQQVLGEIGDTGLTGDANLYFEIRRGGEPQNPLTWLRRK